MDIIVVSVVSFLIGALSIIFIAVYLSHVDDIRQVEVKPESKRSHNLDKCASIYFTFDDYRKTLGNQEWPSRESLEILHSSEIQEMIQSGAEKLEIVKRMGELANE